MAYPDTLFPESPKPSELLEQKSYILPSQLLEQGRVDKNITQFQNFTRLKQERRQPDPARAGSLEGMFKSMLDPNPELGKENASALGHIFHGLAAFDIPVELTLGSIPDVLDWAIPGEQKFSWIQGTAERESFEGWRAVFRMARGEQSWQETGTDIIEAYEKRPLIAQIGLGMVYGGGVAQLARLGKVAKYVSYTIDPIQLPFVFAGKGMRAMGIHPFGKRMLADDTFAKTISEIPTRVYQEDPSGTLVKNSLEQFGTTKGYVNNLTETHTTLNEQQRFSKAAVGSVLEEDKQLTGIAGDTTAKRTLDRKALKAMDDEHADWSNVGTTAKKSNENTVNLGFGNELSDAEFNIMVARDDAMFQLNMGASARNHEIERRTLQELGDFVNSLGENLSGGRLHVDEAAEASSGFASRTATVSIQDEGLAGAAVRRYLDLLTEGGYVKYSVKDGQQIWEYSDKVKKLGSDELIAGAFEATGRGNDLDRIFLAPEQLFSSFRDKKTLGAGPRTSGFMNSRLQVWRKDSLFPDLPSHSKKLRHLRATAMFKAGIPLERIRDMLGHSESDLKTVRTYIKDWRVDLDHDFEAFNYVKNLTGIAIHTVRRNFTGSTKIKKEAQDLEKKWREIKGTDPASQSRAKVAKEKAEEAWKKYGEFFTKKQLVRAREEGATIVDDATWQRIVDKVTEWNIAVGKGGKAGKRKGKGVGQAERQGYAEVLGETLFDDERLQIHDIFLDSFIEASEDIQFSQWAELLAKIGKVETLKENALKMSKAELRINTQADIIQDMLRDMGVKRNPKKKTSELREIAVAEALEKLGIKEQDQYKGWFQEIPKGQLEDMKAKFRAKWEREMPDLAEASEMLGRMITIRREYSPVSGILPSYVQIGVWAAKKGQDLINEMNLLRESGEILPEFITRALANADTLLDDVPVLRASGYDKVGWKTSNWATSKSVKWERSELEAIYRATNIFEEASHISMPAVLGSATDAARRVTANTAFEDLTGDEQYAVVREWITNPKIATMLRLGGMHRTQHYDTIYRSLELAARRYPMAFGKQFESWGRLTQVKIAPEQAQRLEAIADTIWNYGKSMETQLLLESGFDVMPHSDSIISDLSVFISEGPYRILRDPDTGQDFVPRKDEPYFWVEFADESTEGLKQRIGLEPGKGPQQQFISPQHIVGSMASLTMEKARIRDEMDWATNLSNWKWGTGWVFRHMYAAGRGGQAGIVPEFIRAIHARTFQYARSRTRSNRVRQLLSTWLKEDKMKLGIETDSFDDLKGSTIQRHTVIGGKGERRSPILLDEIIKAELRRNGVVHGNQFAVGIKVKDPIKMTGAEQHEWFSKSAKHAKLLEEMTLTFRGVGDITDRAVIKFIQQLKNGDEITPHSVEEYFGSGMNTDQATNLFNQLKKYGMIKSELTPQQRKNMLDGYDVVPRSVIVRDLQEAASLILAKEQGVPINDKLWRQTMVMAENDVVYAKTLLTQVDVWLDEIPPEKWHLYYDLTPEQRRGMLMLKSIIYQMDTAVKKGGINLEERFRDVQKKATAKFSKNYFPRMAQSGAYNDAQMKESRGEVLNNYASFLHERQNQNVWDYIFGDKHGGFQYTLDARIAQYIDTSWKLVIDEELSGLLSKMSEPTKAIRNEATLRNASISALRILVNDVVNNPEDLTLKGRLVSPLLNGKGISGMAEVDDFTTKLMDITSTRFNDSGELIDSTAVATDYIKEVGESVLASAEASHENITQVMSKFKEGIDVIVSDADKEHYAWLKDTWYSKKEIKILERNIFIDNDRISGFLSSTMTGAYQLTTTMRTLKAGLDLGFMLIHGFNSAFTMPKLKKIMGVPGEDPEKVLGAQRAWKSALYKTGNFFLNPDNYDSWVAANFNELEDAHRWIRLGQAEPVAALQGGVSSLDRVRHFLGREDTSLSLGELGTIPIGQWGKTVSIAKRFESSFVGALDVLRVELWKTFKTSIDEDMIKQGWVLRNADSSVRILPEAVESVEKQYHDLGAAINKMTGAFDPELGAMTPFHRRFESAIVFFAPMYRRATLGILADLRHGSRAEGMTGVRRQLAVRQLSGLIMVGLMMGALGKVSGNDDALNPTTPDFMKFRVPGTDAKIGFGTAWYTVMRLAGDLFETVRDGVEGDKDTDFTDMSLNNPILKVLGRKGRSGLAPGAGLFYDLLAGQSYIGEPLRDEDGEVLSWQSLALMTQHTGRSALTFWLDGAFAGSWTGAPVMMLGEFAGLSSIPSSEYDKLSRLRENVINTTRDEDVLTWKAGVIAKAEVSGKNPEINWQMLPRVIQDRLMAENPMLRELEENYRVYAKRVARGDKKQLVAYWNTASKLNLNYKQQLAALSRKFERGEITGLMYNQQLRMISEAKRVAKKAILESDRFEGLLEFFSETREARLTKTDMFYGDLLYDKYLADVKWGSDDGDSEQFDFVQFERRKREFKSQITQSDWEYIEEREAEENRNLPIALELSQAQKELRPYWNIAEAIFAPGSIDYRKAKQFLELTQYMKGQMMKKDSSFRRIAKKIDDARIAMRLRNPRIDWWIVKFFDGSPSLAVTENLRDAWRRRQAGLAVGNAGYETPNSERFTSMPGSGRIYLKPEQLTGV